MPNRATPGPKTAGTAKALPNPVPAGIRMSQPPVPMVCRPTGNQAMLRTLQRADAASATTLLPATHQPMGNQALLQMIQTKLTVNQPGDSFEREADRVSEQVMRMAEPRNQRQCDCGGTSAECQAGTSGSASGQNLQMKVTGLPAIPAAHTAPSIVSVALQSPGQPLDAAARAFMEPRFGRDFDRVRVHTGESAGRSTAALGARAFTLGSELVFGTQEYRPADRDGQRLLAHELTHVVQQSGGMVSDLTTGAFSIGRSPAARIARAPVHDPIHPVAAADLEELMRRLFDSLSPKERYKLNLNSTIAIVAVTETNENFESTDELVSQPRLMFTVAGNRSSKELTEKAAKLGLIQWKPQARTEGRGPMGSPNDAEQLAEDGAFQEDWRLWSMAVSRRACDDCADMIKHLNEHEYSLEVRVVQDPAFRRGGSLYRWDGTSIPPIPRQLEAEGMSGWTLKVNPDGTIGARTEPAAEGEATAGPPAGGKVTPAAGLKTANTTPGENIKATTGEPLQAVEEHGLSAAGGTFEGAGIIGLQVLGAVFNHFGDKKQAEYAKQALDPELPGIEEHLREHPDEGVLLLYNYEQTDAGPDSVVTPGARFVTVHPAYGRTEDEARSHVPASSDPITVDPHNQPVGDSVWYKPTSSDPANYATPWPPIALARFRPGREYLERVQWVRGKFEELSSESLKSFLSVAATPAFQPLFYVLGLPGELRWDEKGVRGHGSTRLNLVSHATANQFSVPAVDGAVPIFAFDQPTDALFEANRLWKTVDNNKELEYVNFELVRWTEPENIDIVKVLSSTEVVPTIPKVEQTEAQIQLEGAPAAVRALYQALTASKGGTAKSGDILERFLMTVPSDLTMDEVDRLTKGTHMGASEEDFFASLRKAIQNLRTNAPSNQTGGPASAIDFRKATPGDYTPKSIKEQIQVLLGSVSWAGVDTSRTYFDNVLGKEGQVVNTFAYGLDDQGQHWGALVEVWVGFRMGGLTPVTVRGSSVLVSEQGGLLYGNSILLGTTFRLQPDQGAAKP